MMEMVAAFVVGTTTRFCKMQNAGWDRAIDNNPELRDGAARTTLDTRCLFFGYKK